MKRKKEVTIIVHNRYGKKIDYFEALNWMNDDIRNELNTKNNIVSGELSGVYMSTSVFFNAYADEHMKRFGEQWIVDSKNPPKSCRA